ncbi:MAG: DNA primase catalytic subunit PriS [Candidatus Micrarchaeia archaeon]|jgi:DNA primase small subunit
MDPRSFILGEVREYYKSAEVAPTNIEKREFAYGDFEHKILQRHLSFKSPSELRSFLLEKVPMHVHYSPALYRFPDARPMERKELIGAELAFDIDITDMDLPCQKVHGKELVCKDCLGVAKEEVLKLIEDFLIPDFGFKKEEIEINFSGNRGYHVHVTSQEVLGLSEDARKEIADYISGKGLDFSEIFPTIEQRGVLIGPKPEDLGWRGKIARNFLKALESGPDALMALGIERRIAKNLYQKRALVEMGIKSGNWDMVYIKKKKDFWKKILEKQVIRQSDVIDRNVTSYTTHTIRLPNTIHGSTGLIAKKLSFSEIEKFDPLRDSIAFKKGEMKVRIEKAPAIVMNSEVYGPFEKVEEYLPSYIAIYLYLKGLAQILDIRA